MGKNSEIRPISLQRPKGPSRAWPLFGGFTLFLLVIELTFASFNSRLGFSDVLDTLERFVFLQRRRGEGMGREGGVKGRD